MDADTQPVVKIKMALCMLVEAAPKPVQDACLFDERAAMPIPARFYETPTIMVDRADCETDESMLQLIPYIVARDQSMKIFMYQRGSAGDEGRLHAKWSIGLGGHMDRAPGSEGLRMHIDYEAMREVSEEIGIGPNTMPVYTHLLLNREDSVGRVHIGILGFAHLPGDLSGMKLEEGNIEDGKWVTLDELRTSELYDSLEPWSQMAVSTMVHDRNASA